MLMVCAPGGSVMSTVVVAPDRGMTWPEPSMRNEAASSPAVIASEATPCDAVVTPGRYTGCAAAPEISGAAYAQVVWADVGLDEPTAFTATAV